MVSTQTTQNSDTPHPRPTDWQRGSVRITAQQRRQILREHYANRLVEQQAVVADERNDRNAQGAGEPVFSIADVRVSNKVAVLQDISATLKAFGDENRDFPAVSA
jgi:hypothetical protein